ncbi:nitrogen permease regulator 2-domain-containing protein [Xylariomycetidae sp. FL2044]|nr:nitrogen permease regulator 2-domain-containing protein [Xylariomycetidae sp. FL2044]
MVASEYAPHLKPPLVDFDIVQEYIIPRKAFFNRFMTVNSPDNKYSILGFPVSIPSEQYHRNEFIFNFGLVVESDVDQVPYERLVRRLAVTFAEMERQNGYLSNNGAVGGGAGGGGGAAAGLTGGNDGRRPIESLLEIIKEDLNNYGECMIPVDEANTLNMKLFPYHAPPPPVRGWHVPVPKMKLSDMVDPTWDLTLQKIIPHVDGVNDVRRIAWLADVSLPLTQCALQHLLYYDTVLLLDMFFFGSCYAPRPGIHDFITNRDGVVDECRVYVCVAKPGGARAASGGNGGEGGGNSSSTAGGAGVPGITTTDTSVSTTPTPNLAGNTTITTATGTSNFTRNISTTSLASSSAHPHLQSPLSASAQAQALPPTISNYDLIKLMTTFVVGRSVMEWIKLHQDNSGGLGGLGGFDVLSQVDVRRLVQFGVIKGFLYRVHKYVVSKDYLALLATGRRRRNGGGGVGSAGKSNKNKPKRTKNTKSGREKEREREREKEKQSGRRGKGEAEEQEEEGDEAADEEEQEEDDDILLKYMDGCHSFDQIITERNLTDGEIMQGLKRFRPGDVAVFYR